MRAAIQLEPWAPRRSTRRTRPADADRATDASTTRGVRMPLVVASWPFVQYNVRRMDAAGCASRQHHNVNVRASVDDRQPRHAGLKIEPPRTGGARVDAESRTSLVNGGAMRVSEYQHISLVSRQHQRGTWPAELVAMTHVNRDATGGYRAFPFQGGVVRIVDVAIHGFDGSDFPQRFEHRGSSHIAGVQNQLDAAEHPGDIGSHEAVCVRDEADDDLLHAWPGFKHVAAKPPDSVPDGDRRRRGAVGLASFERRRRQRRHATHWTVFGRAAPIVPQGPRRTGDA